MTADLKPLLDVLHEEGGVVEQSNFDNYRMLRINEAPVVEVHLIKSTEAPGGIGEPSTAALFPAVANAIFAATGAILSAAYALYLYRRVIFGSLVKPGLQAIQDLSLREVAIFAPLVAATLILGFYPKPIFDVTGVSVQNLIEEHKAALLLDRGASHPREASLSVRTPQ